MEKGEITSKALRSLLFADLICTTQCSIKLDFQLRLLPESKVGMTVAPFEISYKDIAGLRAKGSEITGIKVKIMIRIERWPLQTESTPEGHQSSFMTPGPNSNTHTPSDLRLQISLIIVPLYLLMCDIRDFLILEVSK